MTKAHSINVIAFRAARPDKWRHLRRAAHALLRALHHSRARHARKIINDYRHLLGN